MGGAYRIMALTLLYRSTKVLADELSDIVLERSLTSPKEVNP